MHLSIPVPRLLNTHKWAVPSAVKGELCKDLTGTEGNSELCAPVWKRSLHVCPTPQVLKLLAKATGHFAKISPGLLTLENEAFPPKAWRGKKPMTVEWAGRGEDA